MGTESDHSLVVFDPHFNQSEDDANFNRTRNSRKPIITSTRNDRHPHSSQSSQSDSSDDYGQSSTDSEVADWRSATPLNFRSMRNGSDASSETGNGRVPSRELRDIECKLNTTKIRKRKSSVRRDDVRDDLRKSKAVPQIHQMSRPSRYVRFKYPVRFHRTTLGTQRRHAVPNFDVPGCMRQPNSIAMMPVRQRPASNRDAGTTWNRLRQPQNVTTRKTTRKSAT